MSTGGLRHRLRAILAADAVGYSRLMAADDRATVASLDKARGVFKAVVALHEGRIIDTAGDSVLAAFETAAGALSAALAIQQRLRMQAEALPDSRRLHFRIGVHVGDVIEKLDGSVYGDGVNIAARLQALAQAGGVSISQAVYDSAGNRSKTIFEDTGEQTMKNIARPVRVFRVVPALALTGKLADAPAGAMATAQCRPTNLAGALEALIGRDSDAAAVRQAISEHRIVTILGTGGIGKTRLAQAVARACVDAHRHGVWWIDLAALSSGDRIEPSIAHAANVELADSAAPLASALSQREMLLVLDNCEHLIGDVARVVRELLEAAPRVFVLATSQEPLKLPVEHLYRLEALAIPAFGATLEVAREYSAVQLLERRARSVDSRFELTQATIADAIALCRRLDGVALAIEMAAARLPLLGVEQVQARIDERFRLLRSADRSAPARHQTLRATLDWSYSLLSDMEQAVLRRLGVFAGSFRLDMAQQVASMGDCDEWAVLDALAALADKSLLQVERVDPPRYRLLETMRLYAAEQLQRHDEAAATLLRHGQAMTRLAEEAESAFWESTDMAWWARYAADLDDLEEAYANAYQRRDAAIAAVVGDALERRDALRPVPSARQARLVEASALLPFASGRSSAVICDWLAGAWPIPVQGVPRLVAARQAVDRWRELDDPRRLYLSLSQLAKEFAGVGNFEAAREALDEAHRLEKASWPARMRYAHAREATRIIMLRGDPNASLDCIRIELALAEASGSEYAAAFARYRLADAALMAGHADEAVMLGRAVVAEQRTLFRQSRLGGALHNLCGALLVQGDQDGAWLAATEAWPRLVESGGYGYLLNHLALLGVRYGRFQEAARMLGCADGWHAETANPRESNEAVTARLAGDAIDERLGPDDHVRLRAAGAHLGQSEIDALVQSVLLRSSNGP